MVKKCKSLKINNNFKEEKKVTGKRGRVKIQNKNE